MTEMYFGYGADTKHEEEVARADIIFFNPIPLKSVLVLNTLALAGECELVVVPKAKFLSKGEMQETAWIIAHLENTDRRTNASGFIVKRLVDYLVRESLLDKDRKRTVSLVSDNLPLDEIFEGRLWKVAVARVSKEARETIIAKAKDVWMGEQRELMLLLLLSNDKNRVRTIWAR